jgi:hypothetical protein
MSTHAAAHPTGLHGLIAEFDDPTALVGAARSARASGYSRLDAFSPYPIEELNEALHLPRTRLPWIVFFGGLTGTVAGYGLQFWASVIAYPLNIGGRPLHSMPAFIVPAYETTILFAAFAAVIGMIVLNGLPRPYHPVFNVPQFAAASSDRFFLLIQANDPKFDIDEVRRFLEGLEPLGVTNVSE